MLESNYDAVGKARGLGLMQGIELVGLETTDPQHVVPAPDKELVAAVDEHLREESNVVTGIGGYYRNVICFQPPLTILQAQFGEVIDAFRTALNGLV